MLTNLSKKVSFFCINGHPEPIPLIIKEGNNQFYACPKFMVKDDKHPDGYDWSAGEHACNNRLSFNDAADIIVKFSEYVEDGYAKGEMTDWTNFEFMVKKIKVKVLKFDMMNRIEFGILNKGVVTDERKKKRS